MGLATDQALDFWDQLVRSYHGINVYGGCVCEIFMDDMMSLGAREHKQSPEALMECDNLCHILADIVTKFERCYDAAVSLNEGELDTLAQALLASEFPFRLHFTVRPNGANQQG